MGTLLHDVKYAARSLLKSPGFTIAAVAALALGIGANTAIFSVVNAVLLDPMRVPEPDRFVTLVTTSPTGNGSGGSPAKFAHFRRQTDLLELVAASRTGTLNYTGGATPIQLRWTQASADYFRLVGASVVAGRVFAADEDLPNGPKVALIAERLWRQRFDAAPDMVGRAISLSGEPHTVVGIVSDRLDLTDFGRPPDVWTPFQLDPTTTDQGHYFLVTGRLAPGVTLEAARAALDVSAREYARRFPDAMGGENDRNSFGAVPVRETLVRNARASLMTLMGAVGLVLLIACANVANLLLARATGRRRDIAIRAALGAGRGRIIRQLLTESALLAAVGGACGLALGHLGIRALLAVNRAGLPRIGETGELIGIDWRVLVFTLVVSGGTGILFGLWPAWQSSKTDLGLTLKESGGRTGAGARSNRARAGLMAAEVALAIVLLVGAVLVGRTWLAVNSVDPGFDATNVLTMGMSVTGPQFATSAAVERMVRNGVDRVEARPGVERAATTCCMPLEGGYGLPFIVVGRPLDGPAHGGGGWSVVSPGFFEVFQIPLLRGRTFVNEDTAGAPAVVIINETMAAQNWPEGDPIGERLIIGRGVAAEFDREPEREIVGVVSDIRDGSLRQDPRPVMYLQRAQLADELSAFDLSLSPMRWMVRTTGNPQPLSAAIQDDIRDASGLPVSDVRTMTEVVVRAASRDRFNMWMMGGFAVSALVLAAIGLYGLIAYSVEQRTHEIGIRLALGAEGSRVRRMVIVHGMRLVAIGVVVGLAAAFGLARIIASILFGVEAWDPLAFTVVPVVLLTVAMVAVGVPAGRAARVTPITALRFE